MPVAGLLIRSAQRPQTKKRDGPPPKWLGSPLADPVRGEGLPSPLIHIGTRRRNLSDLARLGGGFVCPFDHHFARAEQIFLTCAQPVSRKLTLVLPATAQFFARRSWHQLLAYLLFWLRKRPDVRGEGRDRTRSRPLHTGVRRSPPDVGRRSYLQNRVLWASRAKQTPPQY